MNERPYVAPIALGAAFEQRNGTQLGLDGHEIAKASVPEVFIRKWFPAGSSRISFVPGGIGRVSHPPGTQTRTRLGRPATLVTRTTSSVNSTFVRTTISALVPL